MTICMEWGDSEADIELAREAYNDYTQAGLIARDRNKVLVKSFDSSLKELSFDLPTPWLSRLDLDLGD